MGQTGVKTKLTTRGAKGNLGQNFEVNIWPIPSWIILGFLPRD